MCCLCAPPGSYCASLSIWPHFIIGGLTVVGRGNCRVAFHGARLMVIVRVTIVGTAAPMVGFMDSDWGSVESLTDNPRPGCHPPSLPGTPSGSQVRVDARTHSLHAHACPLLLPQYRCSSGPQPAVCTSSLGHEDPLHVGVRRMEAGSLSL